MSDDRWGWANDPDATDGQPPRNPPPGPSWDAPGSSLNSTWSETLEDLAARGQRERSRARARRRLAIAAAAVVVVAVVVVASVLILKSTDSRRGSSTAAGGGSGWCATGTDGAVTTVSGGGDRTSPVGVVTTFLSAVIDDRSATDAHATMSDAAVAPTVTELQQWISTLPPSTTGWCAQITMPDSTARLLVNLRLRAGRDSVQVGPQNTFYVSASTPDRWTIDAIVSDDGTRP